MQPIIQTFVIVLKHYKTGVQCSCKVEGIGSSYAARVEMASRTADDLVPEFCFDFVA